jgi:hypothetical protein
MGFKDLKTASKNSFQSLAHEMDKMAKKSESYKDDRFWKAETDKTGNGYAEIRFLPAPDGEDLPWARVWSHGFRGPGGWYIENSLTTIGLKDPVSEMNNLLWESGSDKDKAIARDRKRRLSYISNVLVISDPKNPQNEGKVFLFKYGKKIFEKIQGAMNPEFQDEKPMNPFDFWTGANFKLKIRQVDGYANFDKSEFAAPSALLGGDDAALEKMWKTQHSLKEFTDPKNFKSYDELKARLEAVLGGNIRATVSESAAKGGAEKTAFSDDEDAAPVRKPSLSPPPTKKPAPVKEAVKTDDDDTEDALSYFEKLASED